MQPSVPIATDNIYKFAALFGLALLISLLFASIYFKDIYLERFANTYQELELLKGKAELP